MSDGRESERACPPLHTKDKQMAFNIFKWLFKKNEDENTQTGLRVGLKDFMDNEVSDNPVSIEYYLQRMAFWAIVRKIGAAVASIEWQTYRRGKNIRAKEYWMWNTEPNPNQSKEEFFQQLIGKLFSEKEALVVEMANGYRYVADSFSRTSNIGGDIFTGITIHEKTIDNTYRAKDVIYITYNGVSLNQVMAAVAAAQGKLINSATKSYVRNQGMHGVLNISDNAEAEEGFDEKYDELINNKMKRFFNAENAVLPLFEGYEFDVKESTGGSTKSSLSGTRDIRSLYDDIVELTAETMGVPLSIVNGKSVTKEDFSHFITATVMPLVEMIREEINRKLFGYYLVTSGTYIIASYASIRYTDLFEIAESIDKLISSGTFCINDIRVRLGLKEIDKPWAKQHWITKNYSPAEELLTGMVESEGKEDSDSE